VGPPVHHAAPACPSGLAQTDSFALNGSMWSACEDLSTPDGALALLSSAGDAEWFAKSHEPYVQGDDEDYYLGLGKEAALKAKTDVLGQALLTGCAKPTPTTQLCEPTWAAVERAVPVMRRSGGGHQGGACPPGAGVRTFVGSRGSSVDAALSDHMEDCSSNGFPPIQSYVMNLTAVAMNETPIHDFSKYLNFSFIADGLVGGFEPNVIFYFPVLSNVTAPKSRYWTVIAAPVSDMKGGREQSVWFRFHQLECAGADATPPCHLHGIPQYWDTYWYALRTRYLYVNIYVHVAYRSLGAGIRARRLRKTGFRRTRSRAPPASTSSCCSRASSGHRRSRRKGWRSWRCPRDSAERRTAPGCRCRRPTRSFVP
jgi:hypothetical protein